MHSHKHSMAVVKVVGGLALMAVLSAQTSELKQNFPIQDAPVNDSWATVTEELQVTIKAGEIHAVGVDGRRDIIRAADDWPYDDVTVAVTVVRAHTETDPPLNATEAYAQLSDVPAQGCSATGARASMWTFVIVVLLRVLGGRRSSIAGGKLGVLVGAVVAINLGAAFGQDATGIKRAALVPEGAPPTRDADTLAIAFIIETKALPPVNGRFWTEVRLEIARCVIGECVDHLTVRIPGGRWGDLEQIVGHDAPVAVGDRVALRIVDGKTGIRPLTDAIAVGTWIRTMH